VFRQERQESAVLRDWWTHSRMAASGPKIEDVVDKFAQLHQFLGDEIVISAALDGTKPSFLMLAEVRNPGLKQFLQQQSEQLSGGSKSGMRILDAQELAAAKDKIQEVSRCTSARLFSRGFRARLPEFHGLYRAQAQLVCAAARAVFRATIERRHARGDLRLWRRIGYSRSEHQLRL
jgi:hypothetical protein